MRHQLCAKRQATLASWAQKCDDAVEHEFPARHPSHRTFFQQDRDRILHSEAFRRLGYKTQVFVVHEGDFYRTRLTHSLEVAQIARSIACALECDEDLCEAVAYAHDLGHPPFGHRGEAALNRLMGEALETRFGLPRPEGGLAFEQNFQSYRIVARLERRYPQFPGLNLSSPALEAILRHETAFDVPTLPYQLESYDLNEAKNVRKRFFKKKSPSLEAQIVNAADQIAWVTHDMEDALRVRFLTVDELQSLPNLLLKMAWERDSVSRLWKEDRILWGRLVVRNMIDILINDLVQNTKPRLGTLGSPPAVQDSDVPVLGFSEEIGEAVKAHRNFLFDRVYTHPVAERMSAKAELILRRLFEVLTLDIQDSSSKSVRLLPKSTQALVADQENPIARLQVVVDFIAGMTDRFATEFYRILFEPEERGITSLY